MYISNVKRSLISSCCYHLDVEDLLSTKVITYLYIIGLPYFATPRGTKLQKSTLLFLVSLPPHENF